MSHRAQGIVVLALAVLIGLIIPKLSGTPIPGTATALSIQTPPLVGSCILGLPAPDDRRLGSTPSLTYGACGQAHYGEVVQVFSDGAKFPRIGLDPMGSPDPSSCTQVVSSYLGVDQITVRDDRGDYRSTSFGAWEPVSLGRVGIVGPVALQQEVGQTWIACVTEGTNPAPYAGTVRGAFHGGSLPDSYGMCNNEITSGASLACASPHRVEVFADTPITISLPSQAELTRSCRELLHYLTGRTDLSAGGRLEVQAVPVFYGVSSHTNAGQRDSVETEPGQAFCGISALGTSALTSTLFGLGDRPPPLS